MRSVVFGALLVVGLIAVLGLGAIWFWPAMSSSVSERAQAELEAAFDESRRVMQERTSLLKPIARTLFPTGHFEHQSHLRGDVYTMHIVGTPSDERLSDERVDGLMNELRQSLGTFVDVKKTLSSPGRMSSPEAVKFSARVFLRLEYEHEGWLGVCSFIVGERPDVVTITFVETRADP